MTKHTAREDRPTRRALLAACSRDGVTLTQLPAPLFPCQQVGDQSEGFASVLSFPTLGRRAISIVVDEEAHLIVCGTVVTVRPDWSPTGWPSPASQPIEAARSFSVEGVQFVLHDRGQLLAVTVVALDCVDDPITAIRECLKGLTVTLDRVVRDLEWITHDWLASRRPQWPWQDRTTDHVDLTDGSERSTDERQPGDHGHA